MPPKKAWTFCFLRGQECQTVGLENGANYPNRDWPWVISFTINSGLSWFFQLIPVSEILLTRCDCLRRAKKKSQESGFHGMYISSDGCLTHSWSCLGCSACFLPECNWQVEREKHSAKYSGNLLILWWFTTSYAKATFLLIIYSC